MLGRARRVNRPGVWRSLRRFLWRRLRRDLRRRSRRRSLLLYVLVLLLLLPGLTVQADDDPIEALLAGMSLEHKVGQLFMAHLYGPVLTETGRDLLETWQPGAVSMFNSNIQTPAQITRLTNSYQQTITGAGGVPLLIATDQEGGIIQRLREGFTIWPVPKLLTATDDPLLAAEVGAALASELLAVGINMDLAPVLDLDTNRDNPIIGRRSPGGVPDLVGRTAAGFIRGMQAAGVLATAKHFPGHGDTDEDSHVTLPVVVYDRARLDAVELVPFVHAIEAGVGAVMVAHVWYTTFDPDAPRPASLSSAVVTDLLREALGFDGIIMTDAMDMDAIDTRYAHGEAAVLAILAGVDLIAYGPNMGEMTQMQAMQAVVDAVRAGRIDEGRVDESVRRLLRAKQTLGLFDWQPLDPDSAPQRIDRDAHDALIARLFRAGVTIAHNAGDLLPLTALRVAIIHPANRMDVYRACSPYRADIRWLAVSDRPAPDEVELARSVASQVDVAIVFTRDAYTDAAQQALVTALPPDRTVVVALVSPYDYVRFPQVAGYVVTYSPLPASAPAACAALFEAGAAPGTLAVDLSAGDES